MKYQFYVITPDPEPTEQPVYRLFAIPVAPDGDAWKQAGDPVEVEDDSIDIFFDVMQFRIHGRPDGIGHLDEIKPPRGWTVVARGWLEDDYTPPTEEQREQTLRDAMAKLREIQDGIKKLEADDNEP